VNVDFHAIDELPADALEFWNKRRMEQDPLACFTTGVEWFRMMAEGNDPPATVCVARAADGRPGAILPLLFREGELAAPSLGGWFGTGRVHVARVFGGDLVWDDSSHLDPGALWRGILERYPDVSAIRLDHVASGARSASVQGSCVPGNRVFAAREFRGMPHYRLELPATFEECCRIRSSRSIKQIRRHAKRLGELDEDGLVVVEMRTPGQLADSAGEIERLVAGTWQATALGHGLDISQVARVAERGWVRAFLLRSGSTPVAFVLCYQSAGTLIREQSGYDPEFAKYYPGEVLLYRMLERLYEDDTPRVVDFGVGEGYHKRMFSNKRMTVDAIWVVRDATENRTRFRRYALAAAVDALARRTARRLGIERRLSRRRKK